MEKRNIWEIKISEEFVFFKTIDEVINAIKDGKIVGNFLVMDEYDVSVHEPSTWLEKIITKNNIHMNYIDDNHQVFYHNNQFPITSPIFGINFFNKYQDQIINAFIEYISKNDFIQICNYIFNDLIFEKIIERQERTVFFYNVTLTEEQIKKLQKNYINAYVDGKQVSSKYIFECYTRETLKNQSSIILYIEDLPNLNINDLIYAQDNCEIIFLSRHQSKTAMLDATNQDSDVIFSDMRNNDYFNIKEFLIKVNTLNKPFKINIDIHKRSMLEKSGLLNIPFNNLDITLTELNIKYSLTEYLEEDRKLNELIKNIKHSDLSPYEKYIAIYNIVKKYKPYKESINPEESRNLKYILDNEYMVCVGFAKLLEVLLEKVGINCTSFSVNVDTSYDKGYSQEERKVTSDGHQRLLFNIDDPKYNIHGIYMADATWDNSMEEDLLNYSSMTIDRLQTNHRLTWNNDISLILDVHNFQEFTEQINYLFKKTVPTIKNFYRNDSIDKTNSEIILKSYGHIVEKMKSIFQYLDFENWNKIYSKYKFETEKDYADFLTEIGHFIVSRVNKPINSQKTIKAHLAAKKELLGLKRKELIEIRNKVSKAFYERQKKAFPYYLTDETYLGEKDSTIKK